MKFGNVNKSKPSIHVVPMRPLIKTTKKYFYLEAILSQIRTDCIVGGRVIVFELRLYEQRDRFFHYRARVQLTRAC